MNFIETLKCDISADRNLSVSRMEPLRGEERDRMIRVSRPALIEMMHDYENLDNEIRAIHSEIRSDPPEYQLATLLRHFYTKTGRNADEVMLIIFNVLAPLIEERVKFEKREVFYGESKGNALPKGRLNRP